MEREKEGEKCKPQTWIVLRRFCCVRVSTAAATPVCERECTLQCSRWSQASLACCSQDLDSVPCLPSSLLALQHHRPIHSPSATTTIKKVLREMQTLRAGCSKVEPKKFRPTVDPLPDGAGRPKFNQPEMVTTFTYRPTFLRSDACNFELSWQLTHKQTNTPTNTHANPQTGPITIHCATAS